MTPANPCKKAFYANSSAQVLFAAAADIALGYLRPATAIALKRLGDAFIRLITMRESAGLLRARVNFGAVHRPGDRQYRAPGSAFNVNAAALDARAVAEYAGQTKAQSVSEFLTHIIPNTVVDAWKSWARGTAPRSSGAGSPVN